jgi:hypothetical protein
MCTQALPNPWITEATAFVLDVDAFWEAIEPAPLCISDPSPEFMTAVELMPIVEVLRMYR